MSRLLSHRDTAFRSKVARRIFALIVLAALLPILAIASLIYLQADAENSRILSEQLRRETKTAAIGFSYLLDDIEIKLRYLAHVAPASRPAAFEEIRGSHLAAYRIIDDPAFGTGAPGEETTIAPDLRRHLDRGKAALAVTGPTATPRLEMVMALPERSAGERLLAVTIAPEVLEIINHDQDSILCVLTDQRIPVLCGGHVPGAALGAFDPRDVSTTFQRTVWHADDHVWQAGFWRLYTAPRFHLPALTTVWATTEDSVITRPSVFLEVFPPAIALAVLIVTLVSISLIRRLLTPMDRLKEAANDLARGLFHSRVHIASDDEFEDLGNAFNGMARDLENQFTMLGTLAELDRMVLSAQDTQEVIDVLLERMPEISECDAIAVLEIADGSIVKARWRCRDPDMQSSPPDFGATVQVADLQALQQCGDHLSIDNPERHGLARPFFAIGMTRVVCLPINRQAGTGSVICLGYARAAAATETVISRARSLADRAAVALSNAEWEEKLYHQAHYDALTELPNRQLFISRLDEALAQAQRQDTCVGLLFVDVDRFKTLNDSLGHHAGDQYLVQAARTMIGCIGAECTLARLGGDEFTVIVPVPSTPQAAMEATQSIAERLRKCLTAPVVVNDQRVALSASIGVAIYPTDATSRIELIRCADQAMYHSKELGRNGWSYYSREINASALERLELAAELEGAIARGELQLYLQPQLDCRTEELCGAEVLLRWRHPRLGIVPPGKFIPVAEQMGLIVPIGIWVVEQACRLLQQWRSGGMDALRLAVNISPVQLRHPEHVELLCRTLGNYAAHAGMLELEVTESTCVDDLQAATRIFRRLKECGVSISIDDFGTGYSSMSYLRHFSIDTIKIDQAFVRGLPEDEFNRSFAAAIVTMAHSLGCTVVAEGVETEAQLHYLRGLGCEKAQGYFIARPMTIEDFDHYARTWQTAPPAPLRAVSP